MWRLVLILALASARYFSVSDTVTMMDWTEDTLPRYAAMMRWSQTSFGGTVPIHSDVVDEGRHGPVNAALTPIYDALGVGVSGPSASESPGPSSPVPSTDSCRNLCTCTKLVMPVPNMCWLSSFRTSSAPCTGVRRPALRPYSAGRPSKCWLTCLLLAIWPYSRVSMRAP